MALSNLDNDNITRLFKMININEQSHNNLMSIRNNYSSYSKLELICKQIEFLKKEALQKCLNNAQYKILSNFVSQQFHLL